MWMERRSCHGQSRKITTPTKPVQYRSEKQLLKLVLFGPDGDAKYSIRTSSPGCHTALSFSSFWPQSLHIPVEVTRLRTFPFKMPPKQPKNAGSSSKVKEDKVTQLPYYRLEATN